ncbi:MAG: thioredoxin family protein [Bacteroidales bacterium]|nr:thioredoxin family protein [Bacteroidales bacterium]
MIAEINSEKEFEEAKVNAEAGLFYFSHDDCNVCKVLKPKVHDLLIEDFPKVKMFYVNIHKTPEISGQNSIFAVPTILVSFDRRELFRRSRNIGIEELRSLIGKPYELFFSE